MGLSAVLGVFSPCCRLMARRRVEGRGGLLADIQTAILTEPLDSLFHITGELGRLASYYPPYMIKTLYSSSSNTYRVSANTHTHTHSTH